MPFRGLRSISRVRVMRYVFVALFLLAVPAYGQLSNDECLACHDTVDQAKFGASVHGIVECSSCHADVKAVPHEPAPKKVSCAECHSDSEAAHLRGIHAGGNKNGAKCQSCHGPAHEIIPASDPKSPVARANIARTCGSCHSQKFVMEGSGVSEQPLFSYKESVHGQAVAHGSTKAAVCTDCHGHHEILLARNEASPINRFNIPKTCGQCHGNVSAEFMTSVHGKAVQRGKSQAPVCTDCHGIHNIKSHIDPKSSVASQRIARTTCGQCHGGVKLTEELGVAGGRLKSYEDSYHGLAKRLGSDVAANCASCHGVHNILPSSDPKATTNKANIVKTCGKCHPGAGTKFAIGKVHLEETVANGSEKGEVIQGWVRRIYIVLIVATIAFMLLHNALIWWRKAQKLRRNPDRVVVRMNLNQRLQHAALAVSFTVLVLSGFALAYPESAFAWLIGEESWRRIIHRIAGVVMMVVGVYHVAYMVFTREGRKGLRDFWFRFKDARDLIGTFKYYSGLSKVRPMIGRFSYAEKIEYWAMIWGTIVMAVTGLMLWFTVLVTQFLPRWWVEVALTVHLYEAILATLAVLVWHFYQVVFDPDVYPMSFAWLDGKMTREQYEHEHGLDAEAHSNPNEEPA
jgi:cytochrome b subunit of formate dehydrogenase